MSEIIPHAVEQAVDRATIREFGRDAVVAERDALALFFRRELSLNPRRARWTDSLVQFIRVRGEHWVASPADRTDRHTEYVGDALRK